MRKVIFLCCVLAVAVGSCKDREETGGPEKIAVIPKGTLHVFWKSIHAGAVKAAQEMGVEIIWKGPLKEDDREDQIKVMDNMISRGVSGLVLAPLDDVALLSSVENAARRKIPVVIIDSGLKGQEYVSFVATDNYEGGVKGGQHLASLLGGKGKVVMLRYAEGSASTAKREQGFLDAIAEYPGIEVVSSNQYGGATVESSIKGSENLLARFKSSDGNLSIDGIFCPNESSTFGMLRHLQDSQLAGKVRFVGFDSAEPLVQGLRAGEIDGLVLQDPINMGYLGVKTIVRHLRGEVVEKLTDTGSVLVTAENMDSPEIKNLLEPDFAKWLKE